MKASGTRCKQTGEYVTSDEAPLPYIQMSGFFFFFFFFFVFFCCCYWWFPGTRKNASYTTGCQLLIFLFIFFCEKKNKQESMSCLMKVIELGISGRFSTVSQ